MVLLQLNNCLNINNTNETFQPGLTIALKLLLKDLQVDKFYLSILDFSDLSAYFKTVLNKIVLNWPTYQF